MISILMIWLTWKISLYGLIESKNKEFLMHAKLVELRRWIKYNTPDVKAFDALLAWKRKYYAFEIDAPMRLQPGDGLFITLKGGGRQVIVSEEDFEDLEDTGEGYGPTPEELIFAALKAWHDDTSPKISLQY